MGGPSKLIHPLIHRNSEYILLGLKILQNSLLHPYCIFSITDCLVPETHVSVSLEHGLWAPQGQEYHLHSWIPVPGSCLPRTRVGTQQAFVEVNSFWAGCLIAFYLLGFLPGGVIKERLCLLGGRSFYPKGLFTCSVQSTVEGHLLKYFEKVK